MSIFDVKVSEVIDYEGFWIEPGKRLPYMAVFAIGNLDCTKIFALGYDAGQQILIFHQQNKDRVFKPISQELSLLISTWLCIESSFSQEFIFVGGAEVDTPVVGALTFNENLSPVGFLKLSKMKSSSLSRLKRIEGTDFVIAGLIQEIAILKFDKNQFSLLYTYATYSDYEIGSILFHTNMIYTLTLSDGAFNLYPMADSVNQSDYYSTEQMSPVVTEFFDMKLGISRKKSLETPNFQEEREIISYLANENITYNIILEEEEQLLSRLNSTNTFKRIANSSANYMIAANIDERTLYVNTGRGIDIYKVDETDLHYQTSIKDISAHSVFCVKSLIVIQELKTNDMYIYNHGELFKKFPGKGVSPAAATPGLQLEVKPAYSNQIFLWQASSSAVVIMNIGNLDSQVMVDDFWHDPKDSAAAQIEPITLMLNVKPEKLIGLALTADKGYVLKTYDLEKKKKKTFEFNLFKKDLELIDSDFKIVSIDKSQRTNILFAAVQLEKDQSKIIQVRISKEGLSTLASLQIEVPKFTRINRISSYQIAKNDYLLVAGTSSLLLLKSKDKSMSIIYTFQSLANGEITDACIHRNKFFAVSPGPAFIIEAMACNKVNEEKLEKIHRQLIEESKDEIHYDKYGTSKLQMGTSKFNRLDISKKGDILYVVGKGIVAITGIDSGKPTPTDTFFESKGQ